MFKLLGGNIFVVRASIKIHFFLFVLPDLKSFQMI